MSSKTVTHIDVIRMTLKRLNYAGNDPTNQTTLKKMYSRTMFVLTFIAYILCIILIFVNNNKSIGAFILDIMIIGGVSQALMKYIQGYRYNKELIELIEIVENNYWTTEKVTPSQQQKLNRLYKHILTMQTVYSAIVLIAYVVHSANTFFKGNKGFTCNMWFPEFILEYTSKSLNYEIIFVVQFIAIGTISWGGMVQYDVLFISFIACTIIQLRMLKYKLGSVGTGENKNEFKYLEECIEHHNVLLGFINKIEEVYSMIVLLMIGTSMFCQVVALYALYLDLQLIQRLVFIGVIIIFVQQFFLYCLLGQILMDETDSIATAAYDCKWENISDTKVKMALKLMIQRAQRPTTISMGGFLILTLETFTRVVKVIGSFLTFIRRTTNSD